MAHDEKFGKFQLKTTTENREGEGEKRRISVGVQM